MRVFNKKIKMKKITLSLFLLIIAVIALQAQQMGNANRANADIYGRDYQPSKTNPISQAQFLNDSTIVVETNLLMNVKADSYVAILSLTQLGDKLTEANQILDNRIQNFTQELQRNGFSDKDIFVDFISQVPTYEFEVEKKIFSKTANEVPSGFELKKNIHIAYQKNSDLDKIVLIAANYEIYDLVKVDYHIKNLEAIGDTLRNKAINVIKKKVKQLENLGFNFKTETLKYQTLAEDLTSSYPEERYASYTAYSSSNPKKNVKYSNEVKKNTTYYYSKIGYNNYDLVINPVVLEPAIQYSYTLKVKYSLKKR
jgi:uncharacterized protein YggE